MRTLLSAIAMVIALTVVTGIIYPLAVYVIAQTAFPWQANGSLIVRSGQVIGSELIGQSFTQARYFHPRPSDAGARGYDASDSGGSNLGPTNRKLIDDVRDALHKVLEENPGATPQQVPTGMVTASGSGLDPEISPADAQLQVARVAKARGLSPDVVEGLVREHTRPRFAGVFGEPGVNVLDLNLALDHLGQRQR
ncbi:MAG TPA: K(+)-transporting ATPase subunit C [Candidatus Binataceae bacterium]|jgi:K+-transporting ATPase ATPase C chain|nr:K(+)-transporting ATPase subunit C [Candidatus Binataceae bacterium]